MTTKKPDPKKKAPAKKKAATKTKPAAKAAAKKKPTKKKPVKNPNGRPSTFPKGQSAAIKKLILMGATDKDLAEAYEVTERTVNNWKIKHPKFFQSLKDWRLAADENVEKSLYQRAIGYTHKDTKIATYEGIITDSKEYDKHYPPDSTAGIFWLKNRRPDEWRDKREVEIEVSDSLAERIIRARNRSG